MFRSLLCFVIQSLNIKTKVTIENREVIRLFRYIIYQAQCCQVFLHVGSLFLLLSAVVIVCWSGIKTFRLSVLNKYSGCILNIYYLNSYSIKNSITPWQQPLDLLLNQHEEGKVEVKKIWVQYQNSILVEIYLVTQN